MSERMETMTDYSNYMLKFDVNEDENVFDPESLDMDGCRSLIAQIIYVSVRDMAFEMYKRKLGIQHCLNDQRLIEAVRFFRGKMYRFYANVINFRLRGQQIIEMVNEDPKKYLPETLIASAERSAKVERTELEKYGLVKRSTKQLDIKRGVWVDAEV